MNRSGALRASGLVWRPHPTPFSKRDQVPGAATRSGPIVARQGAKVANLDTDQDETVACKESPPDRVCLKEVMRLSEHLVKLIGCVIVKAHDRQAFTPP